MHLSQKLSKVPASKNAVRHFELKLFFMGAAVFLSVAGIYLLI